MGEFVDKAKGAANQAIGQTKVSLGKRTDDPEMVTEGLVQKTKGKVQSKMGTVKGKLGDRF